MPSYGSVSLTVKVNMPSPNSYSLASTETTNGKADETLFLGLSTQTPKQNLWPACFSSVQSHYLTESLVRHFLRHRYLRPRLTCQACKYQSLLVTWRIRIRKWVYTLLYWSRCQPWTRFVLAARQWWWIIRTRRYRPDRCTYAAVLFNTSLYWYVTLHVFLKAYS